MAESALLSRHNWEQHSHPICARFLGAPAGESKSIPKTSTVGVHSSVHQTMPQLAARVVSVTASETGRRWSRRWPGTALRRSGPGWRTLRGAAARALARTRRVPARWPWGRGPTSGLPRVPPAVEGGRLRRTRPGADADIRPGRGGREPSRPPARLRRSVVRWCGGYFTQTA